MPLPAAEANPASGSAAPLPPVPVLYLGGMARSGSTLFNRLVGEVPGYHSVGELVFLAYGGAMSGRYCGCGRQFEDCPFWSRVGELAFGGWDNLDFAELKRLKTTVDRTARIPLLLAPHLVPSYAAALRRYTELLTPLYRAALEASGARVVVDSTKFASTLYVLRRMPAVDVRVAHIVRDPRGVAYSWSREKEYRHPGVQAGGPAPVMPTWSLPVICRRWVSDNVLVPAVRLFGVPVVRVRYEDLVRRPAEELRRVARLFGDELDDAALAFLSPAEGSAGGVIEARLHPTHTVAGNPDRFETGPVRLRSDERWRENLPARSRRAVQLLTWPLRLVYGYR